VPAIWAWAIASRSASSFESSSSSVPAVSANLAT
jgi:hypothetical protein